MPKTLSAVAAYAAPQAKAPLQPWQLQRREVRPTDVAIDILYCGVCHTDIHYVENDLGNTSFPLVPGHEIVGVVSKVGSKVSRFKPGDRVAVGCMVDSCRTCSSCKSGLEQYCEPGCTFTYGSKDRIDGTDTYGGYSTEIIVDEAFVLTVPKAFKDSDLPGVAPLLCAGITTYSPLKHWKIGPGSRVGVVGLGGLGHMGVKLAHALGAEVTLFTTSESKVADGKRLGANTVVITKEKGWAQKMQGTLDFILDTVAAKHDLSQYLGTLKRDGTLCFVGLSPEMQFTNFGGLLMRRRAIAGTIIGGIQETQEMLDFCAKHGVAAEIEMIPIQKINESYTRMLKNDVKYRFVIDIASLKKS